MRCTIGTTIVMTGMVIAMLAFRPPVIDDPQVAKAQAEAKSRRAPEQGTTGSGRAARPVNPDDAAREKLKDATDAEFNEVPLRDVLNYFADRHAVQFYLDPRSLKEAGIANDSPVTINLKGVPLEMLLSVILREQQLDYRLRNGVIMIASESDVQSQTDVRVYQVPQGLANELAALIPATIATDHWREPVLMNILGGAPAGMMDAAGGTGMQGTGAAPGPGAAGMPGTGGGFGIGLGGYGGGGLGAAAVISEPIGGGGPGMIRVFRGTLVISQTPEVHQKIEKLIQDLASVGAMDPQPQRGAIGSSDTGGGGYGSGAGRGGYGASSDRSGYGTTAARGGYGSTGDPAAGRGGYGSAGRSSDPRSIIESRRKRVEPRDGGGPPSADNSTGSAGPSSGGFTPVGPPANDRSPPGPRGAPTSGRDSDRANATPSEGVPSGVNTGDGAGPAVSGGTSGVDSSDSTSAPNGGR
jgi:hypothetical protein